MPVWAAEPVSPFSEWSVGLPCGGPAANRRFAWFDRTGRELVSAGESGLYTNNFDLSPDGKQIAVARLNPASSQYDIWLIDWARYGSTTLRLIRHLVLNGNVVWSPDGLRIAFTSVRRGNRGIFARMAGSAGEETLLDSPDDEWVEDWSKDGRYIAYGVNDPGAGRSFGGYLCSSVVRRSKTDPAGPIGC